MSPSSPAPAPVEDHLRSALASEAAAARPAGDDSLGAIRSRVRTGRRRRAALVAGVAVLAVTAGAVAVPRLGRDRSPVGTDDSVPATGPPPTSVSPQTVPQPGPADMVPMWPQPGGLEFGDPAAAARAFVARVLGVADPPLSAFRPDGDAAGTVDVLSRGEKGTAGVTPVSRLALRRDAAGHWAVLRATSDDVAIRSPAPAGPATPPAASPLHVGGRGRAFEGVLTLAVLSAGATPAPLGQDTAVAGSGPEKAPFSGEVAIARSPGGTGILVVHDDVSQAGFPGAVPSFAAQAVVLPPAGAGPASPSSLAPTGFRYQPLFPFADPAQVEEWQASAAEGHQPWHLDPEATALGFVAHLGFDEIDVVTSREVRGDEAWIGVGSREQDGGGEFTAAVIHLARWGTGSDAPWEVVGTRDDRLTLDTPAYGSVVSSPLTLGGLITGVDENLRIQVLQLSSQGPLGVACCIPAGGQQRPWKATVAYSGATDDTLTVVVSTGGHRQAVEAFAVTGVRRG